MPENGSHHFEQRKANGATAHTTNPSENGVQQPENSNNRIHKSATRTNESFNIEPRKTTRNQEVPSVLNANPGLINPWLINTGCVPLSSIGRAPGST